MKNLPEVLLDSDVSVLQMDERRSLELLELSLMVPRVYNINWIYCPIASISKVGSLPTRIETTS